MRSIMNTIGALPAPLPTLLSIPIILLCIVGGLFILILGPILGAVFGGLLRGLGGGGSTPRTYEVYVPQRPKW